MKKILLFTTILSLAICNVEQAKSMGDKETQTTSTTATNFKIHQVSPSLKQKVGFWFKKHPGITFVLGATGSIITATAVAYYLVPETFCALAGGVGISGVFPKCRQKQSIKPADVCPFVCLPGDNATMSFEPQKNPELYFSTEEATTTNPEEPQEKVVYNLNGKFCKPTNEDGKLVCIDPNNQTKEVEVVYMNDIEQYQKKCQEQINDTVEMIREEKELRKKLLSQTATQEEIEELARIQELLNKHKTINIDLCSREELEDLVAQIKQIEEETTIEDEATNGDDTTSAGNNGFWNVWGKFQPTKTIDRVNNWLKGYFI